MESGLGQKGNRVLIREPVFASLARASLWPTGHSGGGFLLGNASGPDVAITGIIQTWYRSRRGRMVQRSVAESNQIAQTYPIIGTFTIGSPSGTPTPHLIVTTIAASALAMEADRGRVGVLQAGVSSGLVVTSDPSDMPVLLGRNGDPGLQGSPNQKPTVLMAGGALAVLSLFLLAGVTMRWLEPARQPLLPTQQVSAAPVADPTPEPGDESLPDMPAPAADPVPLAEPASEPPVDAEAVPDVEPADEPVLPPERTFPVWHQVEAGETLSAISIRYYDSLRYVETIRRANKLPDSQIYEGTVITIPAL